MILNGAKNENRFPFSSNGESGGLSTIYTRRRSQHQRLQQYTRLRASATSQSDTPPGAIPLEPSVVPSSSSSKSHPIPSSQENPLGDDGSGSEGNGEGRDVGDSQAPSSDNDSRGASRYRSKRRRKGQQAGAVASRLSWIRGLFGRTSQRAVSFLTIMTTWILFRILLQGFNKVIDGWSGYWQFCSLIVVMNDAARTDVVARAGVEMTCHRTQSHDEHLGNEQQPKT